MRNQKLCDYSQCEYDRLSPSSQMPPKQIMKGVFVCAVEGYQERKEKKKAAKPIFKNPLRKACQFVLRIDSILRRLSYLLMINRDITH
jgi:hypothetical protein